MLVNNGGGLPQGDTDNPELIAQPRGGTPAVIDTRRELEQAARALAADRARLRWTWSARRGFVTARTRIWCRFAVRTSALF